MRSVRITLGRRPRGALLALLLVSQVVAATGMPLPTPGVASSGVPFPCQARACGCLTATACWAGDCCCFTLEEKLLWADAQGFEPPAHVRPLVAARRYSPARAPDDCPKCAAKAKPVVTGIGLTLVIGEASQKCRGQSAAGTIALEPAVVAFAPTLPAPDFGVAGPVVRLDLFALPLPQVPPTPPPRAA